MTDLTPHPLLERLVLQGVITAADAGVVLWWWGLERRPGEGLEPFVTRKALLDQPEIDRLRLGDVLPAPASERVRLRLRDLTERPDDSSVDVGGSSVMRAKPGLPGRSSTVLNSGFLRVPAADPGEASGRAVQVGETLGKILLTERLGQGAAGIVFRGLHQTLNIPVAVKVLRPHLRRDARQFAAFKAEARTLAQLNHPNLVRVLDYEDDPDFPYLVMEYVEGFSLDELIRQSGRLRLDRALAVVNQVVLGLAQAAARGVLHRDVKPSNVLVGRDGVAKVVDLGLSVATGGEPASGKTATGELVGTPLYVSPEQARSPQDIDVRADIYSLGATFYHAVVGKPPFTAATRMQLLLMHLRDLPVPPHALDPEIPAEASAVILRMLAKRPEDRFAGYEELATALVDLMSRPAGPPEIATAAVAIRPPTAATPVTPPVDPRAAALRRALRDGVALAKAGEREAARLKLREVTAADPDSERAWLWLAGVCDVAEEAIPCLQQVLRVNPASAQAAEALAWYRQTLPHLFGPWRCPICGHSEPTPADRCPACEAAVSFAFPGALAEPRCRADRVAAQLPRLEGDARHQPTPAALRALGLAYLNLGRGDEGMTALARAALADPRDAAFSAQVARIAERRLVVRAVQEGVFAAGSVPEPLAPVADGPFALVALGPTLAREAAAAVLSRQGYRVRAVGDAAGIAEAVRAAVPALVLLDAALPGMDGLELCALLREDPVTAGAAVILVSPRGASVPPQRWRAAGAAECLRLPVAPRDLADAARQWCPVG